MADRHKTCFVISPIGEDGSDVRSQADDLFELIINPALEIYGFDIIRADKISSPSVITNDIIKLVQDSELCVVDLTGQNPNVYYECGRRHENGKPTIQLISKGEKIPFDVAGIRTISYDLSNARTIRDAVKVIREFVKPFETSGYVVSSSGASLTSIADSIDRIERQLDRLKQPVSASIVEPSDNLFAKGPKGAIENALNAGRIDEAERLFDMLQNRLPFQQFLVVASKLTAAGSGVAKDILLLDYEKRTKDVTDPSDINLYTGSIVQYYIVNDLEEEGITKLKQFFENCFEKYSKNLTIAAGLNWQLARLHVYDDDLRRKYAMAAADLDPENYRDLYKSKFKA